MAEVAPTGNAPAPAAAASASVLEASGPADTRAAAESFEAGPRRPEPRPEPVETAAAGELPEAAYASPVERMDRPPAELRISAVADVPVEPARTTAAVRAVRRVPVDELPGRHQRPDPIAVAATAAPTPPPAEPTRAEPMSRTVSSPVAPTPAASERTLPTPAVARPEPDPWEEPPAPAPSPEPTAASKPPAPKPVAKAESPGVRVERTSWHPSAARRTAVVALASGEELEVHEGDEVGSLVVSRIEPSGVVFLDRGVEVRRRIGER